MPYVDKEIRNERERAYRKTSAYVIGRLTLRRLAAAWKLESLDKELAIAYRKEGRVYHPPGGIEEVNSTSKVKLVQEGFARNIANIPPERRTAAQQATLDRAILVYGPLE